jgi:hypothetical protein
MARNWLHIVGFGNRNPDVTLYNSPGTNQYKYGWWGTLPLVSGTLRTVRVYINNPSGNPTLEWAIYPSVPANGVPSGSPAASGTITGISAAGWYELTSNANMSVTRGQPFMIRFGCTAGTSLAIKGAPTAAYESIFGLTPAGTWWLSADGSTWSAGAGGAHYINPQLEFSIETGSTTEWFGAPLTNVLPTASGMNSTNIIIGQSYQLPSPIRIEGVAFWVYPTGPPLGLLRCELRSINTSTWQPDMSAAGLIDYHEQEYSWQSVNGSDNPKLVALFSEPRQVQNFAVLLRWARYDSGAIQLRVSWPPDATALSRHGVNSVMRYVESDNGGSSWTVYNDRVAPIRFLGDPYQVGGAGSGVQLPPMPLVQTFM